jgi:CheY-like chemotaxis protein
VSKRKLLLADDSITIQKVVNLTFADEGFDVITVNNGDDALRQISEQRPDIILADVNIPGPNGYEICEMIRHTDEVKDLPVVLLVGSYEPFDPDRAQHVGANDFLTKPFSSIRQLVATVSNLLPEQPVEMPTEQLPEPEEAASPDADTIPMGGSPTLEMPAAHVEAAEIEPAPILDVPTPDTESQTADFSAELTDDIESLYDQSLSATIEIPHPAADAELAGETEQTESVEEPVNEPELETAQQPAAFELGDPSMDDEMIETVYTIEPENLIEPEPQLPSAEAETSEFTETEPEQPEEFQTVPLASGQADTQAEAASEPATGDEQDFLRNLAERQPASYLSNEPENETLFEAEPEAEPEPESAEDEAMAFRAEEPVPAETNGNGTYPHEQHEESTFVDTADQFGQATPWDSVAHPRPFTPPVEAAPTEEFEESDLLDLGESGEPAQPPTIQEASAHDAGAPQFSDDVIDRIADRVVAKLSEQLVREIADRIVPDAVESFFMKKFGRSDT